MGYSLFGVRDISLFDYISLGHFLTGFIVGVLILRVMIILKVRFNLFSYFVIGIACAIWWEDLEVVLRFLKANYRLVFDKVFFLFPSYVFAAESWLNVLGDVLMNTLGLLFYAKYAKLKSKN